LGTKYKFIDIEGVYFITSTVVDLQKSRKNAHLPAKAGSTGLRPAPELRIK
jgi:hypothetical protein